MKLLMITGVLCAVMCVAQAADRKSDKSTTAPKALTIPKDAIRNADGTYNYTDKDGKKWIYASTPFGVVKSPAGNADGESANAPAASPAPTAATKVIDKGDTVRFERPGPFGTMSWEKKKADLTDEERRMVDAQTAEPGTK